MIKRTTIVDEGYIVQWGAGGKLADDNIVCVSSRDLARKFRASTHHTAGPY